MLCYKESKVTPKGWVSFIFISYICWYQDLVFKFLFDTHQMGTLNLAQTVQQLKKILSSVTNHINLKALPPIFK